MRYDLTSVGFNTVIDFILAVLAAVELWQFFLRTLHRDPNLSFWAQFRKINSTVRSRRIWQTLTLSGPLVLSGCASIVKTYVSVKTASYSALLTVTLTETQIAGRSTGLHL